MILLEYNLQYLLFGDGDGLYIVHDHRCILCSCYVLPNQADSLNALKSYPGDRYVVAHKNCVNAELGRAPEGM